MTEIDCYSASLRFYSVTEHEGKWDTEDVIFLVKASTFEEAFKKFLDLGHRREADYIGSEGHRCTVRFAKIVTVDLLGEQDRDGAAVCAVMLPDDGSVITVDWPLDPESSQPRPSI